MAGRDQGTESVGLEEAGAVLLAEDGGAVTGATDERPGFVDRTIDRLLALWGDARNWLPLALAIAVAPGLFLWPLLFGPQALLDNDLALGGRWGAAAAMAGSTLLTAALYLVLAWRAGRPWTPTFQRWNERLLPLLALPLLPFLAAPRVEVDRPWFVFLAAMAIALALGVATFRRPMPVGRLPAWLPGGLALVACVAWAAQMSLLAIGQHHALETAVYDLGIYDSLFWHSIHGEPLASDLVRGGNHVSGHVDPILVLLSPLYLLYPRAESILVLQAVWLAAGAWPLWLLAKRLVGSWQALGFVLIYLLLPSLQGRTLYHFHSLALAGPLLLWCFACLELGWLRRFWIPLALLLLTREDMSLVACVLGTYAILGKGYRRLGLATIGISLAYFAFLKLAVMPDPGLLGSSSSDSYGFSYYYRDLIPKGAGASELLLSLVTNPIFTLQHVLAEPKLRFLAILFLPVALLPLVAHRGRMLLLYGLAFTLLASRAPVYSPGFQYATVLDVFALGVALLAVAELPRVRLRPLAALDPIRARPALVVGMVAISLVLSWKFGAFVPNDAFRAGFHRLVREPSPEVRESYAWVRSAVERIGPDASVSATGRLGPHVSNRGDAYLWPSVRDADYLLLERRDLKRDGLKKLRRLEREGPYRRIDRHRGFLLYERVQQGAEGADAAPAPRHRGLLDRRLEIAPKAAEKIRGTQLKPVRKRQEPAPLVP